MATDCGPVLVVDDDEAFQAYLAHLLETAGLATVSAGDGEQALRRAGDAPAMVVLDLHLPDVSGYTICRKLREQYGERLPILFVSGVRTEGLDRAAGLLLGGDDYLVKPFDPDEFLARVQRLLTRRSSNGLGSNGRRETLTARELEILQQLAAGRRDSEIAEELAISPKTVASHIQHILGKLGVQSRAQAVARAYAERLVA